MCLACQFIVARAPHLPDRLFEPFIAPSAPLRIVEGRTDDVLSISDVVLTASGTATVQTAIHGRPMVVLYKLSPLTYTLGKPLAKVDMYAMVNLIAGKRIVRELIQDACTPDAVADEAVSLLTDRARRDAMVRDLDAVQVRARWSRRERPGGRCDSRPRKDGPPVTRGLLIPSPHGRFR